MAKSNNHIEKSNRSQTLDWALEFKLLLGLAATATTWSPPLQKKSMVISPGMALAMLSVGLHIKYMTYSHITEDNKVNDV